MFDESTLVVFYPAYEENYPTRAFFKAYVFELHWGFLNPGVELKELLPSRDMPPPQTIQECSGRELQEVSGDDWIEDDGDLGKLESLVRSSWSGNPPCLCDIVQNSTPEKLASTLAEAPRQYLHNMFSRRVLLSLCEWAVGNAPPEMSKEWRWPQTGWLQWAHSRFNWRYIARKLKEEDKRAGRDKSLRGEALAELMVGKRLKRRKGTKWHGAGVGPCLWNSL
jgi:hypothetical protein